MKKIIGNCEIVEIEDESTKVILKKCGELSIFEAETYLNIPVNCVKKVNEVIKTINSECENGSFLEFNPNENGRLSLYCASYDKNSQNVLDTACAMLDSVKRMLENTIIEG